VYDFERKGRNRSTSLDQGLAELVIAPDHKTSGLLEDLQLVIQLTLDQFFVKMKVIVKSGVSYFYSTSTTVEDIRDSKNNKKLRHEVSMFGRIF